MIDNETYKRWDKFIADLTACMINAQTKYKNFIMLEINAKEIYDLFFFHIAFHTSIILKDSNIYCNTPNYFKYLFFKIKEKNAKYISLKRARILQKTTGHLCPKLERINLIKEVAARNNIDLKEIPLIYKEYYT